MPDYKWSPPGHPDPPEDQPLGVRPDWDAEQQPLPPVWVDVEFTRTGMQHVPGFVMAASDDRVHVQLVYMGHAHNVWLPRERVTRRKLRRGRYDESPPRFPEGTRGGLVV